MDIEKLIEAVKLCGSTPKVDQCKKCTYWAGGDMSKCIPRMTADVAAALSTLQTENAKLKDSRDRWKKCAEQFSAGVDQRNDETERLQAENEKLRVELERMKKIMRENGIMVIPSKYPGGPAEWNIPKPRGQKEE